MNSLKKLTSLLVTLSLFTSPLAGAKELDRPTENVMSLVEEYIQHTTKQSGDSAFFDYGREQYLKPVVAQIATLDAENFNVLMFSLMDRYASHPDQRASLFALISQLTEDLSADLDATRRLQEGPDAFMLEGSYKVGAWIMIAGSLLLRNRDVKGSLNQIARIEQIRERAATLQKMNRFYRLPYSVATSPKTSLALGSTAAGAGAGYGYYWFSLNKTTHRLNPSAALMVLQAQLACHLSYQGLSLQEEFERIKDKPDFPNQAERLLMDINGVIEQSSVLGSQWSRLQFLDVRDRLFAKLLDQFPKAESWQKFRQDLSQAEASGTNECRQMSLEHLKRELSDTSEAIQCRLTKSSKQCEENP